MSKVKNKKRSASKDNNSSSSSSCSSDPEEDRKRLRKLKKKVKKEERKAAKLIKRELKNQKKRLKKQKKSSRDPRSSSSDLNSTENGPAEAANSTNVPLDLMEKAKAMAPMTKEEWEKKQSIIRRVKDEDTGRYRLIKGDGEVLEEIVSRDRHKEINKLATRADGEFFQSRTVDM